MTAKTRLAKYVPALMHPAVSRAMLEPYPSTPALDLVVRARKIRRDVHRSFANAVEDARACNGQLPADWYERGMTAPPSLEHGAQAEAAIRRRLTEALAAEGLPDDLREIITKLLESE